MDCSAAAPFGIVSCPAHVLGNVDLRAAWMSVECCIIPPLRTVCTSSLVPCVLKQTQAQYSGLTAFFFFFIKGLFVYLVASGLCCFSLGASRLVALQHVGS